MKEEWRDVSGYEGLYQVSNFGRIKSFQYGNSHNIKIMNNHFVGRGYVSAQLWKSGISKCFNFPLQHLIILLGTNPNFFVAVADSYLFISFPFKENCITSFEKCCATFLFRFP